MKYIPIQCKSVIRKVKGRFPYHYDVNIYRGCEHGCLYCFAIYSHDYLDDQQFYEHVYYKENLIEILDKELSSKKWKHDIINFGSVCDSYQPCEKDLKLMREVWKLMIKHQNPVILSTKSKLILRDLDLIKELSKNVSVKIASTITCGDETIQKIIEPNATNSVERMKTLQLIKQNTNAHVSILLMPIIPYINDSYENLEAIYKLASEIGIDQIDVGVLYLRGKTKPYFLNHIKDIDSQVYYKIKDLYKTGSCDKEYKKRIYQKINRLKKIYKL